MLAALFYGSFFYIDKGLILTVIWKSFNSTAELAISSGTPTDEANAEIETQPLREETKTRKC